MWRISHWCTGAPIPDTPCIHTFSYLYNLWWIKPTNIGVFSFNATYEVDIYDFKLSFLGWIAMILVSDIHALLCCKTKQLKSPIEPGGCIHLSSGCVCVSSRSNALLHTYTTPVSFTHLALLSWATPMVLFIFVFYTFSNVPFYWNVLNCCKNNCNLRWHSKFCISP